MNKHTPYLCSRSAILCAAPPGMAIQKRADVQPALGFSLMLNPAVLPA